MACEPRTASPPRPSGMASDNDSTGPLPRKSNGADGVRSKNDMHPRRKYDLMASETPEGVEPMRAPA